MNMPVFTAEASLYKTSGSYHSAAIWGDGLASCVDPAQLLLPDPLAAGWTSAVDTPIGPSQLGAPTSPRVPIICNGSCPPPHCHVHCGPCMPDATVSTGCARTCTTFCSDGTSETFTSECPASACCTQPPVCGPCTGQACGGTFPNCAPVAGTGTQSCTACGITTTRPC
jgi:hypothetical protein